MTFWLFLLGALSAAALLAAGRRREARLRARLASVERALAEHAEAAQALVRRDFALTEANVRLREIDLVKSEFVSVAAHQLRTPLTGIRWALVGLAEGEAGELTGESLRLVREALGATERMIELINDLLNVARIEEGRFGFDFAVAAIGPIVTRAVDGAREAARAKGIRLSLGVPSPRDVPPIRADAEKLAMAFANIIDNAIKYTPLGGTVEITVVPEGDGVAVSVRDTGIGIPRESLRYIFHKFYRADNAYLAETFGTGLGLYVAKNIVEQHGGTISVESRESEGTCFTVRLPARRAAALASN